jgi:hypothetical protein
MVARNIETSLDVRGTIVEIGERSQCLEQDAGLCRGSLF